MRRRQTTNTPRLRGTGPTDHTHSGGPGLRRSAAGPTGSTTHRADVSSGVGWWVRPCQPAFATLSSPVRGRHHRVEPPRTGGLADRVRARLEPSGTPRTGTHLYGAAV